MQGSGLLKNARAVVPHLCKGGTGGLGGEVADLRKDVQQALAPLAAIAVEEYTNAEAVATNAIKTSVASSIAAALYTGAALNGAVGGAALSAPRNVTITTSDHAATWQGHAMVTGLDLRGASVTEQFTLANNATIVGTKMFSRVTSISVDAQADALGTLLFGIGAIIGLAKPIIGRAGLVTAIREIVDGAVAVAPNLGVFALPSTGCPNGTYTPDAPPNGTHDYAIYYEFNAQ